MLSLRRLLKSCFQALEDTGRGSQVVGSVQAHHHCQVSCPNGEAYVAWLNISRGAALMRKIMQGGFVQCAGRSILSVQMMTFFPFQDNCWGACCRFAVEEVFASELQQLPHQEQSPACQIRRKHLHLISQLWGMIIDQIQFGLQTRVEMLEGLDIQVLCSDPADLPSFLHNYSDWEWNLLAGVGQGTLGVEDSRGKGTASYLFSGGVSGIYVGYLWQGFAEFFLF